MCAYFLFGEYDAIIRVWATDEDINKLKETLRGSKIEISRCLLVSSIYSWYQSIIENDARAKGTSVETELQLMREADILQGRFSEVLSTRYDVVAKKNKAARFFMFIEADYRSPVLSFSKLKKIFESKEHSVLSRKLMLSLYSYYTTEKRGLLIKGQAPELTAEHNSVSELQDIVREAGIGSVTYLSAKSIKPESDGFGPRAKGKVVHIREQCSRNLLKLHDCYGEKYEGIGDSKAQVETLISMVAKKYKYLCDYNDMWKSNLDSVRKLYRWVAYKKEADLKSFLMWNFAEIEWEVCDQILSVRAKYIINEHVEDRKQSIIKDAKKLMRCDDERAKEVTNFISRSRAVKFNAAQLTLGLSHSLLGRIASNIEEQSEADIIRDLAVVLKECATVRNKMMHGKAKSLFELTSPEDGKEEYRWEPYINSYLDFILRWPHAKMILLKNL